MIGLQATDRIPHQFDLTLLVGSDQLGLAVPVVLNEAVAQRVAQQAVDDEPVIANGGTAFLDAEALGNDDPFPSVTVSNGGLEIRDGGGLKTNALDVGEAGSLSLTPWLVRETWR